jgi:hypothetical protein
MMPAEGLFALRAHPFGVALKGDRRHCVASSNPLVYVGGSNYDRTTLENQPALLRTLCKKMPAEGLFALRAHPFGVALKGDRRHCVASSNPFVYVGGSTDRPIGAQLLKIIF